MSRYLVSALSVIVVANSVCSSAYAVTFTPPTNNGAPSQATGGATRGNFFTPKKENSAPSQATGGATRGNLFTPAKDNGAPQQASGGATRVGNHLNPSLATTPATLIALLPQSFYGTTVSERPTVMVYIPASNAREAVFSIKDETGQTQYKMTIPVAGKTGTMSTTGFAYAIKLPADAPALAVGKNYQWFLALKIDGQLSPSTPYVDGWIQRIQPSAELATAMQQQDALKRATAFGKHGVWYDCIATLAALYAEQSNNATIIQQWEELLTSINLKEIATATLVMSAK